MNEFKKNFDSRFDYMKQDNMKTDNRLNRLQCSSQAPQWKQKLMERRLVSVKKTPP